LIVDNGVLVAGSINNINDAGFNFNSGTVELTNSGLTVGNGGLLDDNVTLTTRSRVLSVSGDVVVDDGASLTVDSGSYVRAYGSSGVNHFLSNLNNHGAVSVANTTNPDSSSYTGQLIVDGVITNDGAGASLTLDGGILKAGGINTINN